MNRREYLLAAANLAQGLAAADSDEIFDVALALARDTVESEADRLDRIFAHPLGAVRMTGFGEDRPVAAFLAVQLARTPDQRMAVRDVAVGLLGSSDDSDYWASRVLQLLHDDLTPATVSVLARLGWAPRSLAAITWARSDNMGADLGDDLAHDPDLRVRRALAEALAITPETERTTKARNALANDPRFSVRSALLGPPSGTHNPTLGGNSPAADALQPIDQSCRRAPAADTSAPASRT